MTTTTLTSDTLTIRTFTEADYEHTVPLYNALFPSFAVTIDAARWEDKKRPDKCRHARWVAERDGRVVAYAQYDQHAHIFDPGKFEIEIVVDPTCESQGIGSALYATVLDSLRQLEPIELQMWTREDMSCRVSFLDSRGFREKSRMWASAVDLHTFDAAPFEHFVRAVRESGIKIVSRAELGADDPAVLRKLYELWIEVRHDMPLPEGETRQDVTFEEWLAWGSDHPTRVDDGYFIALDGDELVGVSQLWQSPEPGAIRTGLTATRRAWRRRGIAFALKVRALEYARSAGFSRVVTDNASENRAMLSINEQLGFVKDPAWVQYVADWQSLQPGR